MKTAEEVYNRVTKNIKAYESGDLIGGDPYSPIEKYAEQVNPEYYKWEHFRKSHPEYVKKLSHSSHLAILESEIEDIIKAWDIQTAIDGREAYPMLVKAILSKLKNG